MMDGTFVKTLADKMRTPTQIGDLVFRPNDWVAVDPAGEVKAGPVAKAMEVGTLSALRDYLVANRDRLDLGTMVVHVVNPATVQVVGALDARARVRECVVTAVAGDWSAGFINKYWSPDDFVVGLQTRFIESEASKQVRALFSNLKDEAVQTSADDGVTQVVSAQRGVVFRGLAPVPNPVVLTPYRTFREVTQPSSAFVLRVQSGQGGALPTVGLFEGDGGAWRLDAILSVSSWLRAAIEPTGVVVLA